MKSKSNGKISHTGDQKDQYRLKRTVLKGLYPLSGEEVLDQILEQDNPQQLIRELPGQDFFWLVKKAGDDGCLPLLELASEDQWQYLLDLEVWNKDRLNMEQTHRWVERLKQADAVRLVRWLFGKGQGLAYYYFFKNIQVEMEKEDEIYEPKDGFITFDGLFHVRVLDEEHRETIENILQTMAGKEFERYQAFLLGLAGVLPEEIEETIYRMRNVRLAEHGFLPFEEALSVYSPLSPEAIGVDEPAETFSPFFDEEIRDLAPVSPLYHATGQNLLTKTTSEITDNLLLERIRLEFAGLCNQIISADGIMANELEIMIRTCRKAAGYLNLTLERLCGADIPSAEKLLRNNSLVSVFRVGFGLVLELKWEADRWLKKSWFYGRGLDFSFWGDEWGESLAGLMEDRPRHYAGFEEGKEYKDFERLSDLDNCRRLIRRLMVLDKVLEQMTGLYDLDDKITEDPQLSFHPLLFNLWARQVLNLEPCYSSISPEQAKEFFSQLREGAKKPPYQMPGFEEIFIRDFMAYASDLEPEAEAILQDTLSLIWQGFVEEYGWVSTDDLDWRVTEYIWIKPSD